MPTPSTTSEAHHEFFRNERLERFYHAQIRRTAEDFLDALRDMNRDHPNAMSAKQIELMNAVGVYVRTERARQLNAEAS